MRWAWSGLLFSGCLGCSLVTALNDSRCGDGVIDQSDETCDDGNLTPGDGCDAACQIEGLNCGDGVLNAGEQCDPPDDVSCDAQCQILAPNCGDGILDVNEQCDDEDVTPGDGCASNCQVEPGFSCSGTPSVCVPDPVCGNGLVEPGEDCDDQDTSAGDGCDAACAVEDGFTCLGEPSVCALFACGNGIVEGDEDCDDENANPDDGCDACVFVGEAKEEEQNDSSATANPMTVGGSLLVTGVFEDNDPDFFVVRPPQGALLRAEVIESADCADTRLRVTVGPLVSSTDGFGGFCPASIEVAIPSGGEAVIEVTEGGLNANDFTYTLSLTLN